MATSDGLVIGVIVAAALVFGVRAIGNRADNRARVTSPYNPITPFPRPRGEAPRPPADYVPPGLDAPRRISLPLEQFGLDNLGLTFDVPPVDLGFLQWPGTPPINPHETGPWSIGIEPGPRRSVPWLNPDTGRTIYFD